MKFTGLLYDFNREISVMEMTQNGGILFRTPLILDNALCATDYAEVGNVAKRILLWSVIDKQNSVRA